MSYQPSGYERYQPTGNEFLSNRKQRSKTAGVNKYNPTIPSNYKPKPSKPKGPSRRDRIRAGEINKDGSQKI